MSVCPRCGASNDDDAAFCDKCGSRLRAAEIFEPKQYEYLDDEGGEEEEPYLEWEWFGLTYSYSKAGFWFRIGLVLVLGIFFSLMMGLAGGAGYGICYFLIILLGVGLSLLFLILQRGRI